MSSGCAEWTTVSPIDVIIIAGIVIYLPWHIITTRTVYRVSRILCALRLLSMLLTRVYITYSWLRIILKVFVYLQFIIGKIIFAFIVFKTHIITIGINTFNRPRSIARNCKVRKYYRSYCRPNMLIYFHLFPFRLLSQQQVIQT